MWSIASSRATWRALHPFRSISALYALACSIGFRSSRRQFSTSWMASRSAGEIGPSTTTALSEGNPGHPGRPPAAFPDEDHVPLAPLVPTDPDRLQLAPGP